MIVRVGLALRLIPMLATIASWFGRSFEFALLDENKLLIPESVLEGDTSIYYVKLCGFSRWEEQTYVRGTEERED